MKLSKVLENKMLEFGVYSIKNEKDVDSLGLLEYNSGGNICTFAEKIQYIEHLNPNISMIITGKSIAEYILNNTSEVGVIVAENPRILYFDIHNYLSGLEIYKRKKTKNYIGDNVSIGQYTSIAPNNVHIGENVIIEDFVSIRENTFIGDNSIIRSGAIIGGSGFEFKKNIISGRNFPVKHIGGVKIGDSVEIQYNTCIDKAIYPWDDTIIDDYVKIDNLVHIAHGVKIGMNTYVVAGANIGGRCRIGDNAWIGIGAIIRNGIDIASNARVNMGAVVTKSVAAGEAVSGNFAINHQRFIDNIKKTNNEGD